MRIVKLESTVLKVQKGPVCQVEFVMLLVKKNEMIVWGKFLVIRDLISPSDPQN